MDAADQPHHIYGKNMNKQIKEKPAAFQEMNGTKKLRSEELLQGCREVLIEHRESLYRLQITKAGKLILNK
ncbi:MAG: hemin uptake protein HemP [Candidatus Omnitrophica bacterium CG12_big_fil_rev_8_21_14_0_65_45_16]|nr:MAG: hemin uptake protein HemP [Candidatus Omnitrophica bacterium CG12_big_fil_rev_8_21_14_0_65_45_16]